MKTKNIPTTACMFFIAAFTFIVPISCAKPQKTADAATSASVKTNLYSGMSLEQLMDSIKKLESTCSLATVNADSTPNIAVFVPGYADATHIVFGWAPNATKANVLRTKTAAMVYDVPNLTAPEKKERHNGAVVHLQLEEDKKTLAEIRKNNPALKDTDIILKIVKLMPIG